MARLEQRGFLTAAGFLVTPARLKTLSKLMCGDARLDDRMMASLVRVPDWSSKGSRTGSWKPRLAKFAHFNDEYDEDEEEAAAESTDEEYYKIDDGDVEPDVQDEKDHDEEPAGYSDADA